MTQLGLGSHIGLLNPSPRRRLLSAQSISSDSLPCCSGSIRDLFYPQQPGASRHFCFDDISLSASEDCNSDRREDRNEAFGTFCVLGKNQRPLVLFPCIKIQNADPRVHHDHVSRYSLWIPYVGALQRLIQQFELLLVSKKRKLQSTNQPTEFVHVSVRYDDCVALHDDEPLSVSVHCSQ